MTTNRVAEVSTRLMAAATWASLIISDTSLR